MKKMNEQHTGAAFVSAAISRKEHGGKPQVLYVLPSLREISMGDYTTNARANKEKC